MLVFGELVQCYYGDHKFGGTQAEVYAHRLADTTPTVHTALSTENPQGIYYDALLAFGKEAAESLRQIALLFEQAYDAKVLVDGKPISEGVDPFVKRVVVAVHKN